jgi:hypothetical protein
VQVRHSGMWDNTQSPSEGLSLLIFFLFFSCNERKEYIISKSKLLIPMRLLQVRTLAE